MKADANNLQDSHLIDFNWLSLESIANCSPGKKILQNWTRELAIKQYLLFSPLVEMANIFGQSDGGQKGPEARLVTVWDEGNRRKLPNASVCQLQLDLAYRGKKSDKVAQGMKKSLKKFSTPELKP